ncbi:nitrogen permease regulating protein NPR2 [Aspergillus clavatus NRRL 1]|uniref:Nitrogen permease regulator Npr2, putative n=1 Tax=Aspergillus clavatus (strain ATCC 1007 / CBS 513.65 / DSM 816 / NCTC 3887 / NRRL 1 / QM 1276 / 107) TaxID=344612 RepID=A1CRK4_ASPCL|nr:nitrogen permease regulator Npr2, putative [Aspergillus clavatus NRRL 1]EAW08275.1 nitrogen permease regulator Npr2, putative [Aspergillus clavatus NRRL 1]
MIKAIFYSKFDTQEGPKVVHQVPDGAIVPSATAPSQPLFLTFSDISFFVIPRQELCGNLMQVCTNGYRILGYPICMKSLRYDRNEFIFNFCLVLAEEEDFSSYKSVVQKLADLMHGLEEQSGFLSRDHSKSGEGKVYSLCETLMEDLNNYCECMIPIDELNTLNIKLFPVYPAPPPVRAWQVPLFTVRYQAFMDENWDLTMQRIVPHINGVNSVRIISILADTDFSLTCRAIKHLLYYGCIFLLDIFSFSAIYAPTAQFSSTIACDEDMQRECARYVNTLFAPPMAVHAAGNPAAVPSASTSALSSTAHGEFISGNLASFSKFDPDSVWPPLADYTDHRSTSRTPSPSRSASYNATSTSASTSTIIPDDPTQPPPPPALVDGVGIVELYACLKQGQSVRQWYAQNSRKLAHIDIRRFITFGIIKGFLYRVHKYAYATGLPAPPLKPSRHGHGPGSHHSHSHSHTQPPSGASSRGPGTGTHSPYASSVGDEVAPIAQARGDDGKEHSTSVHSGSRNGVVFDDEEDEEPVDNKTLAKYLDGMHCFDQICTELEISEKDLTAALKRYPGEVLIIHR